MTVRSERANAQVARMSDLEWKRFELRTLAAISHRDFRLREMVAFAELYEI